MPEQRFWNSLEGACVPKSPSMRPGVWVLITTGYALVVGVLAAVSQVGHPKALPVLLAVALSLPLGVVSLVGFYVLTGLFNWAAAGFTTSSHSAGGCNSAGHCWSTGTPTGAHGFLFVACVAVLFAGVAVGNSVLARSAVAKRRR